ncbi:hypothetical protein I6F35_06350 [Bradyrhizobium sp. BRP22]|uniref:hypothetical protein n=1 Tax=Bradyrhizobium sp. BRP22 TaxID=2793821 RepID=UPI001CD4E46A|nr:hypothetical protein [Bradyrhizobium sp. BRP22]MCA1452841.1 hypothetical protein [Bradyrhizobium sp. BRP22]
MDVYGKVNKPFWDDRPVAVVGGGPSLRGFDFEQLRGAHVLAVKGSIFDIPWADAGFGLDMPRYKEWRDKLANVQSRVYWAVPEDQLNKTGPPPSKNVTFLKRLDGENLSDDPGEIYGGGTSGFGAIQICIHKRAKQIVLFGFDYDGAFDVANMGGSFRFNDRHYLKRRTQNAANWEAWATHFNVYVPYFTQHGIHVVNACPASAIRCFQKVTLEDGVAMLRAKVGA